MLKQFAPPTLAAFDNLVLYRGFTFAYGHFKLLVKFDFVGTPLVRVNAFFIRRRRGTTPIFVPVHADCKS